MLPSKDEPSGDGAFARFEAAERTRRRRFGVALVSLLALVVVGFAVPAQRPAWTEEAALRFGVQGPTRIVPEIQIRRPDEAEESALGARAAIRAVALPAASRSQEPTRSHRPGPAPGEAPPRLELNDATGNQLRRADLPVVQSEDLVIESLVRPEYPHEARVQGLEAIVEIVALVDERGRVRSIDVESNTGHEMFAEVSRDAVRRCHFKPYVRNGKPTSVYAKFRFNFKLL